MNARTLAVLIGSGMVVTLGYMAWTNIRVKEANGIAREMEDGLKALQFDFQMGRITAVDAIHKMHIMVNMAEVRYLRCCLSDHADAKAFFAKTRTDYTQYFMKGRNV